MKCDLESISRLVDEWQSILLHYAEQFTHDRKQAAELVRETFLKYVAFRSGDNGRISDAEVWLLRTLRELCQAEKKGSFRARLNGRTGKITESLSAAEQELMVLHYGLHLRFDQISEITNLSHSRISDTLNKAIRTVKEAQHEL